MTYRCKKFLNNMSKLQGGIQQQGQVIDETERDDAIVNAEVSCREGVTGGKLVKTAGTKILRP
jgi:hypothetical protein